MKLWQFTIGIMLSVASFFLSGCDLTLSNLTAQKMPQNPSNLYTIAVDTQIEDPAIEDNTLRLSIVIDGKMYSMQRSNLYPRLFEYDYKMPKDRSEAKYYIIATYDVERNGTIRPYTKKTDLYTLSLTNRYVISLETQRGPVGVSIAAVGRGFTKFDRVCFNGTEVDTTYHSPNALSFRVPPLPASKTYAVTLKTGNGELPMGNFRIDPSSLHAQPSRLVLNSQERSLIVFSIRTEAPQGGLALDITTDIPDSIIMPEAKIPSGARSVSVPLEGAQPGHGSLYINASGFNELSIPVDVLDPLGLYTQMENENLAPSLANPQELGEKIEPIQPELPWQPLND